MTDKPIIFSPDPEKKRASDLAWRLRNREKIRERNSQAYASDIEASRQRQSEYRAKNYDRVISYNRQWSVGYRARLREEMIAAYGGVCVCCGEGNSLFLQLDHIHNDGHVDRRINKTSAKLWASLKRAGWPRDRHQLLCANCNFGKLMNGGVCPHVG